jgi:hypothetical protein
VHVLRLDPGTVLELAEPFDVEAAPLVGEHTG